MMWSVSESPVMKMIGTWASALFCLRRRHVSKPSVPGITASIRITSGVTFSTIASASSPSRATSTVMPASSIASVRTPSVPGESSTTSTMLMHSFLGMAVPYSLQGRDIPLEVECLHVAAQLGDKTGAAGRRLDDGVELLVKAAHVADLAEADQLDDVGSRRNSAWCAALGGELRLRLLVYPLDVEERVDLLEQLAQVDGLHHVVVVQALGAGKPLRLDGVRRQHHDGGALARGADALRHLPAVHVGHRDIEQDQVRPQPRDERQALAPARRGRDVEAERSEQLADEIALHLVVVDDQHGLRRPVIAAHPLLHGRGDARTGDGRQQELDREQRALAGLARDRDVAAHHLGQELGDGEAEAGAGRLHARAVCARERQEDALEVARRNADTGILDREGRDLVAIADAEGDVTALGEFDGVGEEVDQNLPQSALIGIDHRRHAWSRLLPKLEPLGRRLQAEHVDHLVEELGGMDFDPIEMEASSLDLGDVEQAVDQAGEMLRAAAHHLDGVDAARRDGRVAFEQL